MHGALCHPMRTHLEIIEAAGGYKVLAEAIGLPPERVRFWERRKAIPSDQWSEIASIGIASLAELADAATKRRVSV